MAAEFIIRASRTMIFASTAVPVSPPRPMQTALIGEFPIERNILDIVEVGEYAEVGKAADTRQEYETDVIGAALEVRVERGELVAAIFEVLLVVQIVDQRLVVFVDENHDAPACLLMSGADDASEAHGV